MIEQFGMIIKYFSGRIRLHFIESRTFFQANGSSNIVAERPAVAVDKINVLL